MKARLVLILAISLAASGCSVRKFMIGKIANAVSAPGPSPLEGNRDVELVTGGIPSFLFLYESMLETVPKHRGLLTQLSQGYTSYTYLGVQQELDRAKTSDYRRADQLRPRAKYLYLRGNEYGTRGLEAAHRGFAAKLTAKPYDAVAVLKKKDLDLLYWTAASLGLAISSDKNDADMIARVPELDALIYRGLQLDETWRNGAFHEFAIILAAAKPGRVDYDTVSQHYQRALKLSQGASSSIHVTYAETVSVPQQHRAEFREMLERAVAVDPNEPKNMILVNELARRRAEWLLERIDHLILDVDTAANTEKE